MKYVKLIPLLLVVFLFVGWSLANDEQAAAGFAKQSVYRNAVQQGYNAFAEVREHLPIDEFQPVIDRPLFRNANFRNASYLGPYTGCDSCQNTYQNTYQQSCQSSCRQSCGWYPGKYWRFPLLRAWRRWRCCRGW